MNKNILLSLSILLLFGCEIDKRNDRTTTDKGIDISQYQGHIRWNEIDNDISFVFIRASMGIDSEDKRFRENYNSAISEGFKVGVYHYYRPNENSLLQAENFIKVLGNKHIDLPIVVDIEACSTIQPINRLRDGVYNWLRIIEVHYNKKPIIYTGDSFFKDYIGIDPRFLEYDLWIADYSNLPDTECKYWQYSKKGEVSGIDGLVDMNLIIY